MNRLVEKTKKQNIPKLRFSEFSGGWEEKKLKEVSSFFSGGTPLSSNKKYYNGTIPFIKSGEISNTRTEQFISELAFKESSAKLVEVGDLLYALYGATSGEVSISKIAGAINQAVLCIKTDQDKSWLFYYLYFQKSKILTKYLQGGQGNLSADIIKNIQVYFPAPLEQQKIASFLESVDQWIESLRNQKENLEKYKKGIMQQIFAQKFRFKDENGKKFPEWEEKRLGEIGELKTSSVDKKINDNEKSIFLLNYMDVYKRDHIFSTDNFQRITAKENQINSFNLNKGDILFTPSSETPVDIGHSAVVMEDLPNVLFSYHLIRFRPINNTFNYLFSGYAFKSYLFYKKLWRLAQGATRYTLSLEAMKEVKVLIPKSLEEQKKIADFLTSIDYLIESKQEQITQAELWKKGLMQALFV